MLLKTEPMSPALTGSQTSIVRIIVSTAAVISASRRVRAVVRGDTTVFMRTSTRLRQARSSSKTVSSPKQMAPATPPAMAGFAKYTESMVAEAVRL